MPLSRIEIEQVDYNRWVAEVEVGGLMAKRFNASGTTFPEIIERVQAIYYEARPSEEPGWVKPEPAKVDEPAKRGTFSLNEGLKYDKDGRAIGGAT